MARENFVKNKIVFLLITILLIGPIASTNSFALHSSDKTVWQLIYIAENPRCHNYDYKMAWSYRGLTEKYFELYQFENIEQGSKCMSQQEYLNYKVSDDVDLLILMFAEDPGQKILRDSGLEGLYLHTGNIKFKNHVVMICDCSNYDSAYETTLSSWKLTHGISHFMLTFKGYNYGAVEKLIHLLDDQYKHCISKLGPDLKCREKIILRPPNITRNFLVMPPYVPAIKSSVVTYVTDDVLNSELLLNVHKEITKWWLKDMISDGAYVNVTKRLISDPTYVYTSNIKKTNSLVPDGFVILEKIKNPEIKWINHYASKTLTEDALEILIDYIPNQIRNQTQTQNEQAEIPVWFKGRASLWAENKIGDQSFFNGIERLIRLGIINMN